MNGGVHVFKTVSFLSPSFWQSGLIISPRMINILFCWFKGDEIQSGTVTIWKWCFCFFGWILPLNQKSTNFCWWKTKNLLADHKERPLTNPWKPEQYVTAGAEMVSNIAKGRVIHTQQICLLAKPHFVGQWT